MFTFTSFGILAVWYIKRKKALYHIKVTRQLLPAMMIPL
jgi:hypothetical protein